MGTHTATGAATASSAAESSDRLTALAERGRQKAVHGAGGGGRRAGGSAERQKRTADREKKKWETTTAETESRVSAMNVCNLWQHSSFLFCWNIRSDKNTSSYGLMIRSAEICF